MKSFKEENESFSEVIMKVTENKKNFRKGFGSWEDKENIDEVIKEGREKLDRDLRKDE